MNKAAVQEIYNRVNEPRNISAIEALGLKSCLYCDLFGTFSVENISDSKRPKSLTRYITERCIQ